MDECLGCRMDGACKRQTGPDQVDCYQGFLRIVQALDMEVSSSSRPARVACAPARRLRRARNASVLGHSPSYPRKIRQAAFNAAVREAVRQAQAIADYQHGVETEFLGPADTGFGG